MKFIKWFWLLVLIFLTHHNFAQEIIWQNTIGGSNIDNLWSIMQTVDGGYILGGSSESNISGDKTENNKGFSDYWIIKLDSVGNILWQKTIGGSNYEYCSVIRQTVDGGYIIGGISNSNISGDKNEDSMGGDDYWVVKIDSTGSVQWQNTIGGSGTDWLQSIELTVDGGYMLGGYSTSNISGDKTENSYGGGDFWIIKINNVGFIEWQKSIGGSSGDLLFSVKNSNDGDLILAGYSNSNISGLKTENSNGMNDYWIVKIDSIGNILWQNTIGGNLDDKCFSIEPTMDSGYILGGFSRSDISADKTENSFGLNDYWLIKIDSIGNINWQKTIGGNAEDYLYTVKCTNNGNYFLAGYSQSGISGNKTEASQGSQDYWVINIDSTGTIQWQNAIGGTWADQLFTFGITSDGEYILGGHSASGIGGDKTEICQGNYDYWLMKICNSPILNMDVETCEQYISPSGAFTWDTSGIYTDYINNPFGCDSIIIIDLEINSVDTSLTINGINLTANTSNATFQWLDCGNGILLIGDTSQSFTPISDGSYAVIINQNGCVDTSGCYNIIGVGISDLDYLNGITVFPNPTSGNLFVELVKNLSLVELKITNMFGQELIKTLYQDIHRFEVELGLVPGMYFLEVRTNEYYFIHKIIKM